MADALSIAKDIIYVVCTPITTFLAIFALFWWERRNRILDRKEAKRKANEEKQKVETEKILALLTNDNFVKVVGIFQVLKKLVDKLESKTIDTGSRIFTAFDVLLYMCHDDNWHKFDEPSFTKSIPSSLSKPARMPMKVVNQREEVMSGVKEIMTFFNDFAFLLSLTNIPCPNNIKLRFSSEVIAMGKIIHPFVTRAQQQLIRKVVEYFGYAEPDNPIQESEGCFSGCIPWRRRRQATCDPEAQALVMNEMIMQPNANQQTSEVLKTYPGHNAIKTAIPYVENLRYRSGKMYCEWWSSHAIDTTTHKLMKRLEEGQLIEPVKVKILHDIKALWSELSGDLLHQLRMILFKQLTDPTFSSSDLLGKFHEDVKPFSYTELNYCQPLLDDMQVRIAELLSIPPEHLKGKSTWIFLERHSRELREFVRLKLHTSTEEIPRKRRSSI